MNRFVLAVVVCLGVASTATAKEDPDLFRPDRTTGGQLGIAAGTIASPFVGPEAIGIGAAVGHGTDRIATRITNDITGPTYRKHKGKFKN